MAFMWRSPSREVASFLLSPSLWMWLSPCPPWRRLGTSWAKMWQPLTSWSYLLACGLSMARLVGGDMCYMAHRMPW